MSAYQPTAINHAHASENRIHADDVAKRYGFRGGLVPGVAVYGYMTYPISRQLEQRWLDHSQLEVRFLKPAYDGERITIERSVADGGQSVSCRNDDGLLLANMTLNVAGALPAIDARAHLAPATSNPTRAEIAWDAISVDQPFAAIIWRPSADENETYTDYVADDLAMYRSGVVHPHLTLHWANQVLSRRFVLPAWVHVGSQVIHRRCLHVGDTVELRTIPIEKWRHKGHEFIKLYIAYMVDAEPAVEIYHTAIYKLAERAA
ncbi:MAG: hypothetical protein HC809_00150 [Gammaproteobacteria bacterium]|nr:hypothetical protein [Gammaproteobacteria bacterium]